METNQEATAYETDTWYEAQRQSGPGYGWVTLLDADTRDDAERELYERYSVRPNAAGYRIVRRRGQGN